MPNHMTTPIPAVPARTPMFDGPGAADLGPLNRTWFIFFEKRFKGSNEKSAPGPFVRTLLLKDSTVGDDIADHVTIYTRGTAVRIVGVLRKAITTDLKLKVRYRVPRPAPDPPLEAKELITITIPLTQKVDDPFEETRFLDTIPSPLTDGIVLIWDVKTSDGQKDKNGVASFTLEWQ